MLCFATLWTVASGCKYDCIRLGLWVKFAGFCPSTQQLAGAGTVTATADRNYIYWIRHSFVPTWP